MLHFFRFNRLSGGPLLQWSGRLSGAHAGTTVDRYSPYTFSNVSINVETCGSLIR